MTTTTRYYVAAGAELASEVALPGLRPAPAPRSGPPQVSIRYGSVADHLGSATLEGPAYEADATSFLLKMPQLRCRVADGREIVVDRRDGVDEGTVQTFLLGPALAALCYQRGLMPLSATAVAVNGAAIAFVGASGSGKSTLGAFLARRGHALLSEDMVPVGCGPQPVAYPCLQHQRLWRNVVDVLGLDHHALAVDRPGLQRYRVAPERTCSDPLPLRRLYMLGARPDAPPGHFERLQRLDAIEAVAEMLVLPALWPLVNGPEAQFRQLVALVGNSTVLRWTRRLDFDELTAQLDALEADMRVA